jgi:cytochrome c oxidase cbb3-type subunit IV
MGTMHGIWTGTLIILFVLVVIWAWSDARKRDFADAERLPLEDDRRADDSGQRGDA